MGTVKLTVAKATLSSTGGFVVTLKELNPDSEATTSVVDTPFGKTIKEVLNTYYMKLQDAPAIGFSAHIDLSDYDIVNRDFTTDDKKDLTLKWLHIK